MKEQGILSAICETYTILRRVLGLPNKEIADIFKSWNASGELENNFLVDIGKGILRFTKGDGIEDEKGIIEDIEDKVVQDVDSSGGTGVWTSKVFFSTSFRKIDQNVLRCRNLVKDTLPAPQSRRRII